MDKLDWCGIDVGSETLVVALRRTGHKNLSEKDFPNTPTGHRQLIRWLTRSGQEVRACLEATGTYGRDLALRLAETPGVEVMIANPRAVRRFAEARLERSKTDELDARVLLHFAARVGFQAWEPPSETAWQLLGISRRLGDLARMRAREKNRLHAGRRTTTTATAVICSIERTIAWINQERDALLDEAEELIAADPEMTRRYERLLTVRGFGRLTAIRLLGELAVLPAHLGKKQWVALAGLDPVRIQSGKSDREGSISRKGNRRIRRILFTAVLSLARYEPPARAFYERLKERGKTPRQAQVALMRKLLHGVWGMLHYDQDFDGNRLFPPPREDKPRPRRSRRR